MNGAAAHSDEWALTVMRFGVEIQTRAMDATIHTEVHADHLAWCVHPNSNPEQEYKGVTLKLALDNALHHVEEWR